MGGVQKEGMEEIMFIELLVSEVSVPAFFVVTVLVVVIFVIVKKFIYPGQQRLNARGVVYYDPNPDGEYGAFCTADAFNYGLKRREKELKKYHRHAKKNGVTKPDYDAKLSLSLVRPTWQCMVLRSEFKSTLIEFAQKGVLLMQVRFEVPSSTTMTLTRDGFEHKIF